MNENLIREAVDALNKLNEEERKQVFERFMISWFPRIESRTPVLPETDFPLSI